MSAICYIAAAPLISCEITATPSGISSVSSLQTSAAFVCTLHTEHYKNEILAWLHHYAQANTSAILPIPYDIGPFTDFQKRVWDELQKIPFNHTASYKEIAQAIGIPRAARAIGNACNRNPLPLFIPCHRIISSSGNQGGFAFGAELKKTLLDFESRSHKNTAFI